MLSTLKDEAIPIIKVIDNQGYDKEEEKKKA
jgi:hypothetical protein